jgi:hypothetical protein
MKELSRSQKRNKGLEALKYARTLLALLDYSPKEVEDFLNTPNPCFVPAASYLSMKSTPMTILVSGEGKGLLDILVARCSHR